MKIRKEGYSVRRNYEQFYREYGEMTSNPSYPTLAKQKADFKTLVVAIFAEFFPTLDEKSVLWGKSQIFMRLPVLSLVEAEFQKRVSFKNEMARRI